MLLLRPSRPFALHVPVFVLSFTLVLFAGWGLGVFHSGISGKTIAGFVVLSVLLFVGIDGIRTVRLRGSTIVVRSAFKTCSFERSASLFKSRKSLVRGMKRFTLHLTDGQQEVKIGEIGWGKPSVTVGRFTSAFVTPVVGAAHSSTGGLDEPRSGT